MLVTIHVTVTGGTKESLLRTSLSRPTMTAKEDSHPMYTSHVWEDQDGQQGHISVPARFHTSQRIIHAMNRVYKMYMN